MLAVDKQLMAHAFKFDAPVNSSCFAADGEHFAFGLGDGGIVIAKTATPTQDRIYVQAHTGAVPQIAAYGDGFISLSDDGTLKTISVNGEVTLKADFGGAWTESLCVHHKTGAVAVADGRKVHLWMSYESDVYVLPAIESTVNGICFTADAKGMACAHRDGVTLWAWPHYEPQPIKMPWKGAHMAVTMSADRRWVVTAMQEGALHMWQMALKRDYQMRGYWVKPTSMAWSADGKWLGTSGAEAVILWPFDKAGPEGREALQLGWSNGTLVSAIAAHPKENIMVAGFEDGGLALVELKTKKAYNLSAASGSPITTCSFANVGGRVIAGSQNGGAVFVDLEG